MPRCIIPSAGLHTGKAAGTGHYDSIMVGLLFLLYPVYLLFAALLCWKVL